MAHVDRGVAQAYRPVRRKQAPTTNIDVADAGGNAAKPALEGPRRSPTPTSLGSSGEGACFCTHQRA